MTVIFPWPAAVGLTGDSPWPAGYNLAGILPPIMRIRIALFAVLFGLSFTSLQAAGAGKVSKAKLAALEAADTARVEAMKSGNREALGRVLADELHYAHSTGDVDTKASLIDKLTSGKTKYESLDYEKREFSFPATGMALMTGRVHIKAIAGGNVNDAVLSYLAVWRLEKGQWRFLAWQSARISPKQ